jgi:hypothetical protein
VVDDAAAPADVVKPLARLLVKLAEREQAAAAEDKAASTPARAAEKSSG